MIILKLDVSQLFSAQNATVLSQRPAAQCVSPPSVCLSVCLSVRVMDGLVHERSLGAEATCTKAK